MSVYCSECGQRGHNRRNGLFHKNLKPLTSRQVYDRRYGLKLSVRSECRCGATIVEKRSDGEPMSLCRACLDKNAAKKRADVEGLKRLREIEDNERRYRLALELIRDFSADGNAIALANEALGQTQQPKQENEHGE